MMATRRSAKVVPLRKRSAVPTSPHECPSDQLLGSAPGLRVLLLALEGLDARAQVFDLDSDDVRREVGPLMALVTDIQDAIERETI